MANAMFQRRVPARTPRVFRERPNWIDVLSEREVREKYRLSKALTQHLHDLIEEDIRPKTQRSHSINSITKLLITLQFLAKGEFYSEGGLTHGVSKSSICRCIWQVTAAIYRHVQNIKFPTTDEELRLQKQKYYNIAHIPNCIGAIDCTLVEILSPRDREDVYVCRKGYHAINVQAVVNTDMKFTNVVARWPGSTHDNVIFENSGLKQWLDRGNHGWLIGDSGYALKRYMLTPKINPTTRQEIGYNQAHSRTRMVVEKAFGLLKSRFRCLHKTGGCLQFSPEKCALVFVVCAKLHNMCIDDGMPVENVENDNEHNDDMATNFEPNAMQVREALINTF